MYKATSAFEYNEKQYKMGDEFPVPSDWHEDMQNFEGNGIRFVVPFQIEEVKSHQWLVLPVTRVEDSAPAPTIESEPIEKTKAGKKSTKE